MSSLGAVYTFAFHSACFSTVHEVQACPSLAHAACARPSRRGRMGELAALHHLHTSSSSVAARVLLDRTENDFILATFF